MSLPKIKKINKNMVIAVASTIGVSLVGGVIYAVNDYYNGLAHPQKQSVSYGNDGGSDLPSATQNVSVEVNNTFTNGTTSKLTASSTITSTLAKTESTIAPPVQTTTVKVNNSIPSGTPVTAADNTQPQQKRSTLLITGNRSDVDVKNNNANSISGTNTSVGTGTIDTQISQQSSPYTLVAGTYIPITMQSGLNSEQRGQIVGMVSRDVYDSATGKYLLIPQGSKVVGTYDNSVAYGQKRLIVGWNRLIYPDANGTSVLLHGQPGTNLSGYSGFDGTVDNHYLEIYGSSFLIGGIMGAQAAATGNQGALTQPTTTQTMAAQLGNQMGQTGLSVVQKGLNIPPTIIINPGYRGYIGITSDLVLKPYIRGGRS
jgi:type IV secretory pathway VirB10-like protein